MQKKFFLLAALSASCVAQAQEDSISKSMDEVVLIANKFEQKQSTTGKVVTVINKEQIQQYAGRSLLQLLDDQAGVSVSGAALPAGSVHTLFM
ncbi:MAG TPA: hypothetical protein VLJ68_14255, partial [Chitinophagaceae bacterium]|nr:hypothetical protein [Chitinophagaceae bacterium]